MYGKMRCIQSPIYRDFGEKARRPNVTDMQSGRARSHYLLAPVEFIITKQLKDEIEIFIYSLGLPFEFHYTICQSIACVHTNFIKLMSVLFILAHRIEPAPQWTWIAFRWSNVFFSAQRLSVRHIAIVKHCFGWPF